MHVRCPHCHSPIELADAAPLDAEIPCHSCGSSFHLIGEIDDTISLSAKVRKVGRFELVQEIGRGAFGAVWKARDPELDRFVAVKLPRKAELTRADDEQFLREARAAAQLSHPNIISVHEVGRDEDQIFIVSDFIDGVTLSDRLTAGPLGFRESAKLCQEIANSLHYAHLQGIIHRDLKPSNIMLKADGTPVVMDFGLAKRESGEITMTVGGVILGTPAYMPPEQATGLSHKADRRSDVYSLGVILFELLSGELPFRGNKQMLIHQVVHEEPGSPRKLNDRVPKDLETVCLKCMQKSPERRYDTADALAADLDAFLKGVPISAKPVSRFQRVTKWVARNRALSALGVLLIVSLLSGLAISSTFAWQANRRSEETSQANDKLGKALLDVSQQRTKAEQATNEAIEAGLAEKQRREDLEYQLYVNRLTLAQFELSNDRVGHARDLLKGCPDHLRCWEWGHMHRKCNLQVASWEDSTVRNIKVSTSNEWIATSSFASWVVIRNADTYQPIRTISLSSYPNAIGISADDKRIACTEGKLVSVWDPETGERVAMLETQSWSNQSLGLTADGDRIAVGSIDGMVRMFDVNTEKLIWTEKTNEHLVQNLGFNPDGNTLAVTAEKGIDLRNSSTGELIRRLSPDMSFRALEYSRDGKLLFAGASSIPEVFVWDIESESPEPLRKLSSGKRGIGSVAVSSDGKYVAAGNMDTSVRVWNLENGKSLPAFRGHTNRDISVAFAGSRRLYSAGSSTVNLWDLEQSREPLMLPVRGVYRHSFDKNSDRVALGLVNGSTVIIDIRTMTVQAVLTPPQTDKPITTVSFTSDGKQVLAGSAAHAKIWHWNLNSPEKPVHVWETGKLSMGTQALGERRALIVDDLGVHVADLTTGSLTTRPLPVEYRIRSAEVHTGTNRLAVTPLGIDSIGGKLPGLSIYDFDSMELISELPIDSCWAHAFSPDGRFVVAGDGIKKRIIIWDIEESRIHHELKGHNETVRGLAFSPDGKRILSSDQTAIRLWDASTGENLISLLEHGRAINSIGFNPSGEFVITADTYGTLLFRGSSK